MKKQDLVELGIADDIADKIFALHGKGIEAHKTAAEASRAEVEILKNQLTEANKQIADFKDMDIEGIKKAADDWKEKAEKVERDSATQLTAMKFDHAIESAIVNLKARNNKAVQALLNRDALKIKDDGTVEGLDDQLTKIKSENEYLFADTKEPPKIVTGANSQSVIGDKMTEAARKHAGLPVTAK